MNQPPGSVDTGTPAEDPTGPIHRFAHDAMATTFEAIIVEEKAECAEQAAIAAFDEVDRLEIELSRFIETSDVSRIVGLRAGESVRVSIAALECLKLAARVHEETGGAFDVTIGELFSCWFCPDGSPQTPSEEEIARARERTGMHLIGISEEDRSVSVKTGGVRIDLGGVGKGYAVDRMAEIFREWRIESALLHGGESSVLAMGSPPGMLSGPGAGGRQPGEDAWSVRLRDPGNDSATLGSFSLEGGRSLSGSGAILGGRHIIDPRTGRPAEASAGAWAAAPTAALSDALSTSFVMMSEAEVAGYCRKHPRVSGMLAVESAGGRSLVRFGEGE